MKRLTKVIAITAAAAMIASSAPFAFAADEEPPAIPEGGMNAMTNGEEPPEKPEGGMGAMTNGEEAPEKPEGGMGAMMNGEEPPEKPDEETGGRNTLPFTDVGSDDWFYESVAQSYMRGLVYGVSDTEFAPQSELTGGAVLTMLYRADGNKASENQTGAWYDEGVEWAKNNSIITGEWSFDPEAAVTREQMMDIVYKYLTYKGIDQSETGDISAYADAVNVSDYAIDAVKWLVGQGIIAGDETGLRPADSLTRAEMSAILIRTLDKYGAGARAGGMDKPSDTPNANGAPGGFGGGSQTVEQGASANTIAEDGDYSGGNYASTGDNENALRIEGASVTLDGITVNKSAGASSNAETGDFYGMNAALLATDGANVTITNATVTSSAQNGNGIFSYGSGTVVNVSDSVITTTADNSGGIQTTGGGTTNASNLTVNTSGSSAAAIRSDRGGGTVIVNGGEYTSNGYNSPAVYSTADITVSNASLTANNSEALVIEGKNSITLKDCDVYGNMSDTKGTSSDENVHNVMIYQSMSGDAEVGTSSFAMSGGTLTSNNGDVFYITNTHSLISLSDVAIENKDSDGLLMRISGNSASRGWGGAGKNGAQAEVTADNQELNGDIEVDSISTLTMSLQNGSVLTGKINIVENAQGGTAVENNADITIDADSAWNLTGDCVITSLTNNGAINYNGYTITLADGTVLSE